MKICAWLPVFENYGKLYLIQNGTNYKFIQNKSGTEQMARIWARNSE
jgi:hypothetical protein